MRPVVPALLLVQLAACRDDAATDRVTFTHVRDDILVPGCAYSSCHGASAMGGLTLTADDAWEALVDAPSTGVSGEILVIPGDPDGSYLVAKLEGAPGIVGAAMPQGRHLGDADQTDIRDWIASGARDD